MDFSNPIDDLDWIYGLWKGTLSADGIDSKSYLHCRKFGIDIIEIKHIESSTKPEKLLERNFLFFDKTREQMKLISFNSEGYIETSNLAIKSNNKQVILTSDFESGYNLPPNMKIIKEFTYKKNAKQLEIKVKMGLKEEIVAHGIYTFSGKK
ncbi:MAG: hypothetical protein H7644_08290 [Candidatus Heimdallarchaeota archaeon]|nr:hypothetical protein [Candidatus Heimdallarchaeota archaeon]MCK5143751.1 hypothetical protein [Candidatus Heimdallarchaeota archaeon]